MSRGRGCSIAEPGRLRAWLEYVAETAIAMLDDLDAAEAELEDDDAEDDRFAA